MKGLLRQIEDKMATYQMAGVENTAKDVLDELLTVPDVSGESRFGRWLRGEPQAPFNITNELELAPDVSPAQLNLAKALNTLDVFDVSNTAEGVAAKAASEWVLRELGVLTQQEDLQALWRMPNPQKIQDPAEEIPKLINSEGLKPYYVDGGLLGGISRGVAGHIPGLSDVGIEVIQTHLYPPIRISFGKEALLQFIETNLPKPPAPQASPTA